MYYIRFSLCCQDKLSAGFIFLLDSRILSGCYFFTGAGPRRRLYMSDVVKEAFSVDSEFPGYTFVGWAKGWSFHVLFQLLAPDETANISRVNIACDDRGAIYVWTISYRSAYPIIPGGIPSAPPAQKGIWFPL